MHMRQITFPFSAIFFLKRNKQNWGSKLDIFFCKCSCTGQVWSIFITRRKSWLNCGVACLILQIKKDIPTIFGQSAISKTEQVLSLNHFTSQLFFLNQISGSYFKNIKKSKFKHRNFYLRQSSRESFSRCYEQWRADWAGGRVILS